MIVIGVVLIGMFLIALYYFAIFTVPAIVGLWVFFWAMGTGAGLASPIVGFLAGFAVYLGAQLAFVFIRSTPIRLLLMVGFGVPAGLVAYNAILQLSEAVIPSPVWRQIFAVPGAIIIGLVAITRIAAAPLNKPAYTPPISRRPPVKHFVIEHEPLLVEDQLDFLPSRPEDVPHIAQSKNA